MSTPRAQRREGTWWSRWPMIVWLTVVWVLLWGELSVANVLTGAILGAALVGFLPMPKVGFGGRVWLPGVLVLLVRFAWDVIVASVHVAAYALRFGRQPHGAVIRVRLRSHSDLLLTLTAQFTSLVPGSIIVEALRLTGTIYVHVFDAETVGGIEAARATVFAQERRLMYALASDEQLEAAGMLSRSQWWRGGWRNAWSASDPMREEQS